MNDPAFDLLQQFVILVAVFLHWQNRPRVPKVVTDIRLGQIGMQHFDTPTKSCYDYGCTSDCPVARSQCGS